MYHLDAENQSEKKATSQEEEASSADNVKDLKEAPENTENSDTTEENSKDKQASETPKTEKKANQDNLVERRAKERGSRIPSEIIIETYYRLGFILLLPFDGAITGPRQENARYDKPPTRQTLDTTNPRHYR